MARIWILLLPALLAAACGGSKPRSAASIRSCMEKRVARSSYDRVVASTEEGVVSLNYYRRGNETAVSIFPSEDDAAAAEEAEARLGDAHDRRVRNVLYSGGGAIEEAVRACAR